MRWSRVAEVVRSAIADRATPGACLAIGASNEIHIESFGRLMYDADSLPTAKSTIWDLASLTKVVGTTTAAMLLYESGDLPLDVSVSEVFPAFPHPDVTVRNLLLHNSGLAASHPSPTSFTDPGKLMRSILSQPLTYDTGSQTVYSDLGFIVLGRVIESLSGEPLDRFLKENVWEKLGMPDTGFNPSPEIGSRCAPTEPAEPWRKNLAAPSTESMWTVGEVHDPTAAILRVAGHAGLFSTIADLAKFMGLLTSTDNGLVKAETLNLFITPPKSGSSRALGWDTPSPGSSAGHRFGPRSFGHTGFTGTSIWADPDRRIFAILLTNRVHPTAEKQKIREVRIAFHDAVIEDWEDQMKPRWT